MGKVMRGNILSELRDIFKPVWRGRPERFANHQAVRGENWSRYELFT